MSTQDMDMFDDEMDTATATATATETETETETTTSKPKPTKQKKRKLKKDALLLVSKTTDVPSETQDSEKKRKRKTFTEEEKTERKKKRDISVIQSSGGAKRFKRKLLSVLQNEYSDNSILTMMSNFNEHDTSEKSNERGNQNIEKHKGAFFFTNAEGKRHMDKAGIIRSEKNCSSYIGRVKEQLIFSIVQRCLLSMGAEKRKTISERDVTKAIASIGLTTV